MKLKPRTLHLKSLYTPVLPVCLMTLLLARTVLGQAPVPDKRELSTGTAPESFVVLDK